MLLVPPVLGATVGGWRWVHALLLVAWVAAYLAQHAASLWLKARRRRRYRPPVLAYGTATATLGAGVLAVVPSLWRWGLVLVPLLVASLVAAARRADRSVLNDVVTVCAAGLMTVVAAGVGGAPARWGLPGAGSTVAWAVAGVVTAYFVGTVPYVKTLIRDRGSRPMYVASVGYHATLAALALVLAVAAPRAAGLPTAALAVLAALLTVRATVVPRRWPRATPAAVGAGELVATAAVTVVLLA